MTKGEAKCQKMPKIVVIIGEVITGLLGFIGLSNVALIVIICLNKNLRGNIYVYILNMSITSLVFLSITILDAIYIYYEYYPFGERVLNFHTWIWEAILNSNVLSLLALTYERYNAVFNPVSFVNSTKRTWVKVGCIWVASTILAIPFIFAYRIRPNNCTSQFPFYDQNGVYYSRMIYSLQSFFLYFSPMIVMTWAYTKIIWWKKKSDSEAYKKEDEKTESYKELMSLIKLAIIMVLYFFIFWTPFILTRWIYFFNPDYQPIARRFSQMFLLLYPSFSAIVYVCTNKKLRTCVKEYICCCRSSEKS